MRRAAGAAAASGREAGFTLVEVLVAVTMSVVVVGAVSSMLISAMRSQPEISKRSQNISSARWVLERLTREIRNGIAVDQASASSVSLRTYVRRTSCGGEGTPPEGTPAIECEVTYTCTTTKCSRIEAAPGVYTGAETTIFEGIDSSSIFNYSPNAEEATYIGVTLHIPNPSGGGGGITVSDGASLRNATLIN